MFQFQLFVCATIVFVAYFRLGYYRPWAFTSGIKAYFREKNELSGDVLMVLRRGVPIGTLMCSVDHGWLPTDIAFPSQMAELRRRYGYRIGYFGKFAVIPALQGKLVGKKLLADAVTGWSIRHGVDVAVMMVNPMHVGLYRRYGAVVIARSGGTKGMEKAPAVLMVLDFRHSPEIMRRRAEYILANTHPQTKVAA